MLKAVTVTPDVMARLTARAKQEGGDPIAYMALAVVVEAMGEQAHETETTEEFKALYEKMCLEHLDEGEAQS